MFNQELFSHLVKTWRAAKTLRDFANDCGVSVATISRIENGGMPDVQSLMAICKHCKLSPILFMVIDRIELSEMSEVPDLSKATWAQVKNEFYRRIEDHKEMADRYEQLQ